MQLDADGEPPREFGLTHREIAERLGIGRARVFYHEQEALKKMKRALEGAGIRAAEEFELVPLPRGGNGAVCARSKAEPAPLQFSPQHGWLKVNRILSLNGGSESVEDVVRAFRFLKQSHEVLLRPPVIIRPNRQRRYVVQAAADYRDAMMIRCWPTGHEPRSVTHLAPMRTTAIVQSEFASDSSGAFDVPILICVILS
jgi:hypothetical protein